MSSGLPVAAFKESLIKQTVEDAVEHTSAAASVPSTSPTALNRCTQQTVNPNHIVAWNSWLNRSQGYWAGEVGDQAYLVGHGHDPSHAAVAGVAGNVQLDYVEAGRYALAV